MIHTLKGSTATAAGSIQGSAHEKKNIWTRYSRRYLQLI